MLKIKSDTIVPVLASILTLTLALFVWNGKATEESPTPAEECPERLKTITVDLEQARQAANERVDALEKSIATTERQLADLQRNNLSLQEERDMAHEDINLMRAEMQRCTGDRAHLDDVALRYQTSQTQVYDLQQRLRKNDWIKKQLDATLQENDRLRSAYNQNVKNPKNDK